MTMRTKENTRSSLIMLVAVLLALLCMLCVPSAKAEGELVSARACLGFAPAYDDTFSVNARLGEGAHVLPDAYMFWSRTLELFHVQRWFGETAVGLEKIPMPIPAGISMIIPAPPPQRIDGLWKHVILINASATTDSVYCLPMNR